MLHPFWPQQVSSRYFPQQTGVEGRDPVAECFRNRNSRNGSYTSICFRGWRNENRGFVWSCVLDPDAGSWARACVVAPLMPLRCHHRPPSSYLCSAKENAVRPRQLFHSLRGGSTFSQCIAMPTIAFSGAGYRQHDFSPGQPAFGHDACGGAHRLFTQPCNGLYTSRISPCAGRKQHRSWFGLGDRESLPNCHPFHLTAWPYRVHLYP